MKFFAHSTERPDRSDWQLLRDHSLSVGERMGRYASAFEFQAIGDTEGRLHDLGKYTLEFDRRLDGLHPRMDHATWGAKIACKHFGAVGYLLAYGIAGHHAGLANGTNGVKRSSLQDRLNGQLFELRPEWRDEIALPEKLERPEGFKARKTRGAFQLQLLIRMLFSCLVDADYIDTDNFYRRIEGDPPRPENAGPELEALRDRLDTRLAGFDTVSALNRLRADILEHARSHAMLAPGLFSLTVPTGGGKTLTSLAFALDHAIAHGMRRIIFVIPYTSIVEQTAAVFREALGDLGQEAVLEHHSAFIDDPNEAREAKSKRDLAMQNWDTPIVVTTSVQFFESLFADRPSRCRKLHHIAGSVVILDEAQALPLNVLRPCMTVLDELALNYRTSIVLCTATQPALRAEDGFVEGFEGVRELTRDPSDLYRRLRRVNVRHVGTLDDDALADHLRSRAQALCIVNNRRHARTLFEAIADIPGARHLTTFMCARHRSRVLAEIRQDLLDGAPCRVISTSLIEAGVDIDFPTVLRAEAGLDSIAQAAGRCNRNDRRAREDSDVLVFVPSNPLWKPPPDLVQFAQAFRMIEANHREELLAPEALRAYFTELYWQKGKEQLDKFRILEMLKGCREHNLPFETLAQAFKMIETTMRPVIIPWDDNARRALDELRFATSCGRLARDLQPYVVQVPRQAYDALWKAHAIQAVAPDRYGEQFVHLVNQRLYDERFGLHWDDPQFLHSEGLVL